MKVLLLIVNEKIFPTFAHTQTDRQGPTRGPIFRKSQNCQANSNENDSHLARNENDYHDENDSRLACNDGANGNENDSHLVVDSE